MQMQLHVDRHRERLDAAICRAIGVVGDLRWVSPVRSRKFKEYKDALFLRELDLGRLRSELQAFWPSSGPRWDGLAICERQVADTVVLVEAKNYPREVRGRGCAASSINDARGRIERALIKAAVELGATNTDPWMGPLYQYANRLAHVSFLRKHGVSAYMVNVCFYDDPKPSRRTSEQEWQIAAAALKREMGFAGATPNWLADIFLPYEDGREFLADTI